MSPLSTPGQRRKRRIKILLASAVLLCAVIAWFVEGPGQRLARAAIADPAKQVIQAQVVDLQQQDETYRTLKGRKRTRTTYLVDLAYTFGEHEVQEQRKIGSDLFDSLEQGGTVELWAIGPKHDLIRFRHDIVEDAEQTPLQRSLQVLLFGGGAAVALGFVLVPWLGREPDGYMPDGFYSDSSWLDIEDHELVAISDGHLIRFKFDKSNVKKVQTAYQHGTPLLDVVGIGGRNSKLDRVPLSAITDIEANHFDDSCTVRYRDSDSKGKPRDSVLDIEFLNPTVKAHAMERIAARIGEPGRASKEVVHKTRLQSITPGLIGLAIALAGLWYFEHWALVLLLGLGALMATKSIIARLWRPTVVTAWRATPATA